MKIRRQLKVGAAVAADLVESLEPFCLRVEIAGSIRRGARTVGDIEIVAIGIPVLDLVGEPAGYTEIEHWKTGNTIPMTQDGPKAKRFFWSVDREPFQVDLYLATPDNFGLIYMLRTGPADFIKRMVMAVEHGGMRPYCLVVRGGRVWGHGRPLDTPEEKDIFDLWNIAYIAPGDRT